MATTAGRRQAASRSRLPHLPVPSMQVSIVKSRGGLAVGAMRILKMGEMSILGTPYLVINVGYLTTLARRALGYISTAMCSEYASMQQVCE